jgi:hypothetical protein
MSVGQYGGNVAIINLSGEIEFEAAANQRKIQKMFDS